jgi:hypothetical protein
MKYDLKRESVINDKTGGDSFQASGIPNLMLKSMIINDLVIQKRKSNVPEEIVSMSHYYRERISLLIKET